MILNILLAILMLGVVIFIHEFGHFIVAKANGVAVVEFAIGFGPKIVNFKKGETNYCLKLIPFGGSCLMLGDDLMAEGMLDGSRDEDEDEEISQDGEKSVDGRLNASDGSGLNGSGSGADASDSSKNVQNEAGGRKKAADKMLKNGYAIEKSFANKPVWSRIAIIAAGPIFNFLLAYVLAVIIIGSVGVDLCTVDVVEDNSPAAMAGIREGDLITKINNNNISFSKEYAFYIAYHAKDEMNITYVRDGEKHTAKVVPEYRKSQVYRVGISITPDNSIAEVQEDSPADNAGLKAGDIILSVDGRTLNEELKISDVLAETKASEVDITVKRDGGEHNLKITPQLVDVEEYYTGFDSYGYREKTSPIETVTYAFKEVGYWIETVVKSVGMMFTGQVSVNDLSGPVGVVDAVNTVVEQSKPDGGWYVFLNVINFTMMISANLGVMNLLPLPALDGGRLVFMLIELVRGKPVKKEHEGIVHFVGMVLLMILMVYILFKDIRGLF